MELNINLNETVEVELTKYGKKIYSKYIEAIYRDYKDYDHIIKDKKRKVIEGKLKTELWDIMNIFGDVLYMGNTDIPFVKNEIRFVNRK